MAETNKEDGTYRKYIGELDTLVANLHSASTKEQFAEQINKIQQHCYNILEEEESTAADNLSLNTNALFKIAKVLGFRDTELADRIKALEDKLGK